MTIPAGKWLYCWKPANFGTPTEVANYCAGLGLTAITMKVANGYLLYDGLDPYIEALRAKGIAVGGYHYLYCGVNFTTGGSDYVLTGITPEREAEVSLQAIDRYDLTHFSIDAEREFKVWNQNERAARYMTAFKPYAGVPVCISTYRFPSYHPEFAWKGFMTTAGGVDFYLPQVYWAPPSATRGPVNELRQSWSEYQTLAGKLGVPMKAEIFVPTGRCYIGDGYPSPGPTQAEMIDFLTEADQVKRFQAASFWALDFIKLHTGGWARGDAIRAYNWTTQPEPPEPPEPEPDSWWVQVVTSGDSVYLRPQPDSSSGMPYSGKTYNGLKLPVVGSVKNSKGETWLKVSPLYVAEWLTKPTTPP